MGGIDRLSEIGDKDVIRRYPLQQVKLNTTSAFRSDTVIASLSYLYTSGFDSDDSPGLDAVYENDRHLADLSLTYRFCDYASAKLVIQNVLAEDTPPATFNLDKPQQGNLGADETRVYLSCNVAL